MPRASLDLAIDPRVADLVRGAARLICRPGLEEARAAVQRRLIASARLIMIDESDAGSLRVVRLRPFAELVLREIVDIVRSRENEASKVQRILAALVLGGY